MQWTVEAVEMDVDMAEPAGGSLLSEPLDNVTLVLDTSALLGPEQTRNLLLRARSAVVPAAVLSELDGLKDSGDSTARAAVNALASSNVRVQSELEAACAAAEHFNPSVNDDRVLLCALQLASSELHAARVRIVTRDVNLRNRANALKQQRIRGCSPATALEPPSADELPSCSEPEAMELEKQRSSLEHDDTVALSDARQVLQAALLAAMREALPPEDVVPCLSSRTPPPEKPWNLGVVLRELKQKWLSVCSSRLPREVCDGVLSCSDGHQSASKYNNEQEKEESSALMLAPVAITCESFVCNSPGVVDEAERSRLRKALSRLRTYYEHAKERQ